LAIAVAAWIRFTLVIDTENLLNNRN
jgi:hypothetical protein